MVVKSALEPYIETALLYTYTWILAKYPKLRIRVYLVTLNS
jgi:hypothetical protein